MEHSLTSGIRVRVGEVLFNAFRIKLAYQMDERLAITVECETRLDDDPR